MVYNITNIKKTNNTSHLKQLYTKRPLHMVCYLHSGFGRGHKMVHHYANKSNTTGVWSRNGLHFRSTWIHRRILVGFVLLDI